MIKWPCFLGLLFVSSTTSALARSSNPLFTDSSFVGLVIHSSTFKDGEKALKRISFRKPEKSYRCVRTRDGGWAMINNIYFIKVKKARARVSLVGGDGEISKIIIDVLSPGEELAYHSIVLGKTTVKELQESLHRSDWKEIQQYDQGYFYLQEGDLRYCVKKKEGQSIKDLQASYITRFILQEHE